jgi:hypothetical protein
MRSPDPSSTMRSLGFTTRMDAIFASPPPLPMSERRWLREDGFEILREQKGPTRPRNTNLERAKDC